MRHCALFLAGLTMACSPAADRAPRASPQPLEVAAPAVPAVSAPTPEAPPTPQGVVVRADPPPPFTYWAPAGSVIRNHGNPGLWVAYLNGRQVKTYFGDDCGASRLQDWLGKPVDNLPQPAPPVELRVIAEGDAVIQDLRPNRLNVTHDRQSRQIKEIACY